MGIPSLPRRKVSSNRPEPGTVTILIVDDHPTNREFIVTLLGHQRHRLLEASDGAEALALVRAERPELVITDILMPTMDGYEFVRQLREDVAIADTEIIFYSADYRGHEARDLATTCGVSRVLTKPCEPEEILRAVDEALGHATQPKRLADTWEFDRAHQRLLTDKLSEKADSLQSANRRLFALAELNLELASERDPNTLLNRVCRGARDLIGAKCAVLCISDKRDAETVHFATSGLDAAMAKGLERHRTDNGLLGQVMRERMPLRITNPGDSQTFGLPPGYPAAHSALACPITSRDAVYGWICLMDKLDADAFSAEDEHVLSIHAAQVGRIYENGSLYIAVSRHAAQLEAEATERERASAASRLVVQRLEALRDMGMAILAARSPEEIAKIGLQHLRPLVPFSGGTARVFDLALNEARVLAVELASGSEYDPRARLPLDHFGMADLALLKQGRVCLVPDVMAIPNRPFTIELLCQQGMRSYVRIPLMVEGALVGALNLWSNEIMYFTEEHLGIARAFADQLAITLQQAILRERIERLNRVHAVLSGINTLIVRVRDRDELFGEACRIAVDAGAFKLAWIGVFDRSAMRIEPLAWAGAEQGLLKIIQPWLCLGDESSGEHSAVRRAVAQRQPVISNDVQSDPQLGYQQEHLARGIRSLAVLPLLVAGEPVGVLSLYAEALGFFDDQEMRVLRELAGDIGFALDHIEKEQKLNYLAYYDALTGLPNYGLFQDRLSHLVRSAQWDGRHVAVVVCDIRRFRHINTTLGRHAGDELLRAVAQRLKRVWPEPDNVARVGGDCFVGALSEAKDASAIAHLLEHQAEHLFKFPITASDQELEVSVSAGIAIFPVDGDDADSLFRNAEAASTKAKAIGERYLFYRPEMNARVAETLLLENKLRRAIEKQEFTLHYQPKVTLDTGEVSGLEALLRWNDPERGLIAPAEFIPMLEETGMILVVGVWAIRQALADRRAWMAQGFRPPRVAVNVSSIQLKRPDFVSAVKQAIEESGEASCGLDLEITESLIMEDIEANVAKLIAIRDMGIEIAIDDFGTGYSSLSYLARLPVNALKIDHSFISTVAQSPDSMAIVSTIISLAHALKRKVIAEGVETEEQANLLKLLKCDEMQGFLVSRPLAPERVIEFLAK